MKKAAQSDDRLRKIQNATTIGASYFSFVRFSVHEISVLDTMRCVCVYLCKVIYLIIQIFKANYSLDCYRRAHLHDAGARFLACSNLLQVRSEPQVGNFEAQN